jgi:hypothetical protein
MVEFIFGIKNTQDSYLGLRKSYYFVHPDIMGQEATSSTSFRSYDKPDTESAILNKNPTSKVLEDTESFIYPITGKKSAI